jgi:VTC domain
MASWPSQIVEAFAPVGLEQLDVGAALRERIDVKYVIPLSAFAALAERLMATHAALEIAGCRAFAYRSTYFDTHELDAYRAHLQGRRRRYKCRSREYCDSGAFAFEVKQKGLRGRTVKHRMPHDGHELSDAAIAFLRAHLGRDPDGPLVPALAVTYSRVTLVAAGERVTCDFDLRFEGPGGAAGRLDPGTAIVESKSARGNAAADRALRELGHRPEAGCSKYCLGVALTRAVAGNPLRPLLRRHFSVSDFSSAAHRALIAGGDH